jgi:hypothetical protein
MLNSIAYGVIYIHVTGIDCIVRSFGPK